VQSCAAKRLIHAPFNRAVLNYAASAEFSADGQKDLSMKRLITASALAVLAMLSVTMADIRDASAQQLCRDGQEMAARNPCTCRPPLKFLPGNICGSGQKVTTQPAQPGVAPYRGRQCTPGQNVASGCGCTAPLVLLPAGRCDYPTAAGAKCLEGQNYKQTKCSCTYPLSHIGGNICGRKEGSVIKQQGELCVHGQPVSTGCKCTGTVTASGVCSRPRG
jgi:hypothetical protein